MDPYEISIFFPQNNLNDTTQFCEHILEIYMSHFSYSCKMQYPLNLVLENCKYL